MTELALVTAASSRSGNAIANSDLNAPHGTNLSFCNNDKPTASADTESPEIRATATESCVIAKPCHLL
jgi:hypothetical protein